MNIRIIAFVFLMGCSTFRPTLNPIPVVDVKYLTSTIVATRNKAATGNADDIKNYIEAGMTLSKARCDTLFVKMNQSSSDSGFIHSSLDSLSGLTAAALGLAGVAGGPIGGVVAGTSFINASFKNYTDQYVPSPDLPALQNLVIKAQWESEKAILAANLSVFSEADRALLDYDRICTFAGMRFLVTQSVNAAKVTAISADESASKVFSDSAKQTPAWGSSICPWIEVK